MERLILLLRMADGVLYGVHLRPKCTQPHQPRELTTFVPTYAGGIFAWQRSTALFYLFTYDGLCGAVNSLRFSEKRKKRVQYPG